MLINIRWLTYVGLIMMRALWGAVGVDSNIEQRGVATRLQCHMTRDLQVRGVLHADSILCRCLVQVSAFFLFHV